MKEAEVTAAAAQAIRRAWITSNNPAGTTQADVLCQLYGDANDVIHNMPINARDKLLSRALTIANSNDPLTP